MNIAVCIGAMPPAGITVFMTTAQNGVTFCKAGENDIRSEQSYIQLKKQFDIKNLITLHQRHSADIVNVGGESFATYNGASGDGLFTASDGLVLGVMTADCFPVMLAGKKCIAALHCGWRGTLKGIIANAANMFAEHGDAPEYAYIGAGISKEAFIVQDDFVSEAKKYITPEPYLFEEFGKRCFDLARLIKDQLEYHRVNSVECLNICTYGDRRFHSYRRDGENAGRMLSVIYRTTASL